MIHIKRLGIQPYTTVFEAMKQFTQNRDEQTVDQIWTVQHPSVFTQGQAGKPEHLLFKNDIPIVQSDRGGQITYHGPGQIVIYPLLKLKRYQLTIRKLVCLLEQSMIEVLKRYQVTAYQRNDAPGVYVDGNKIGSLGLRIRHGCAYHGLALNVDMDLTPFSQINPCGLQSQKMTQLSQYSIIDINEVEDALLEVILKRLGYTANTIEPLLNPADKTHQTNRVT